MTDGCWIQLWGDKSCAGPSLRLDATSGTLLVPDLDAYYQSDGAKEGNEPNSLKTGTRAWLVVYKDDEYEGKEAMFGPNTQVDDLDDFGMGGNISSLRFYDYRPAWFNESTTGGPFAMEANDSSLDAASVNDFFRTATAAALNLIPEIGGALGTLVGSLWPNNVERDQVWGSFQNYINQAIAGVYWQLTYDALTDMLESLFNAANDFVVIPDEDQTFKAAAFRNLYDLVNNSETYFVDQEAPERKLYFMIPYATLRLATLRENLQHYSYYYGSDPSPGEADRLATQIHDLIASYLQLLNDARSRILDRRGQMVNVEDDEWLVDTYYGRRSYMYSPDKTGAMLEYIEKVNNQLALTIDKYSATSQLWPHFDPAVTGPVEAPVLNYITGPEGTVYPASAAFSQLAQPGQAVTGLTLWGGPNDPNAASLYALQLYIDGVAQDRVGRDGGTSSSIVLGPGELIDQVSGSSGLNRLVFLTNEGQEAAAGDPIHGIAFTDVPIPGTQNTRLTGLSGCADSNNVLGLRFYWACDLAIEAPSQQATAQAEYEEAD